MWKVGGWSPETLNGSNPALSTPNLILFSMPHAKASLTRVSNSPETCFWLGDHPRLILSVGNSPGASAFFSVSFSCTVLYWVTQSCPTVCSPMDCNLPDSSAHGDSPAETTGVGRHALFQGIFPIQGSDPGLLHCRWSLYSLSHPGSLLLVICFSAGREAVFWSPLCRAYCYRPGRVWAGPTPPSLPPCAGSLRSSLGSSANQEPDKDKSWSFLYTTQPGKASWMLLLYTPTLWSYPSGWTRDKQLLSTWLCAV